MRWRGEAGHVEADLGDGDVGRGVTDPGHRRQPADGSLDRSQGFSQGRIDLPERGSECIDQLEMKPQQCAVVIGHPAAQGLDERRQLVARRTLRELGEARGIGLARDQGFEHARPLFCRRSECWEISRVSCLRVRVRSLSSWIGVAFMATCVQPCDASHSDNASKPLVVVAKLRTS